jgi:tetratricopeptide (TPR) repeat protein
MGSSNTRPRRLLNTQIVQDFHLQDCDQNAVSISFAKTIDEATNSNVDTLDPSFMYTQILKEILLTIDFDQTHIKEFATYCREQFDGNYAELKNVNMIEKDYRHHQPIWWYTYECFLYSMLNRALRTMEVDVITTMGFFVRDLHEHIATLHSEQYGGQSHSHSFIVYRGQGLSQADFNQLQSTQGGLLAYNNFLSTSQDHKLSLKFAQRTINTSDKVGILFVMTIDPSISTTPFANIKKASYYKQEEILFSMHSVFRIGQVKQIERNNNRFWQVELTLTSDRDPQLQELTKYMQEDIEGPTGWFRLGRLMMKVAQYDRAQQVFDMILDRTTDQKETGRIYYYLGWIKKDQGKYTEAITYYEKSLEISQKTLPENHPDLADSYNNIGLVYNDMGEYSKALSYYEKGLEIKQKLFLKIIAVWLLLTTTSEGCIRTWASTRKHFHIMKKHLKSSKKVFLQIIPVWLLLTTTSDSCMATWASTRKHFHIMKKHLKSSIKLFLQIIPVWLLLTTTSEVCMTTWASTRKHFHIMKKHLKSDKKLFLKIILIWLLLTPVSVQCIETWASTRKHFYIMKKHLKSDKKLFLKIILI